MSTQEKSFPIPLMESAFSDSSMLDPETCNNLSLEEKRKLVHEIARNSKDAPEILRAFTRRELLKIICCEMGKERKYTGYSKSQMIQHLLKLISNEQSNTDCSIVSSPTKAQVLHKRKRNIEAPLLQEPNGVDSAPAKEETAKFRVCENVACRANLNLEDPFCRRCSCCICHRYDDNKDPSLWLTCGCDDVVVDDSCGMSCHLECVLKHERSGFVKKDSGTKLDGNFYCVFCGKVNDIMRSWKKQLVVAIEARRVDVLCLRVSLCYQILLGTDKYKELQTMVENAVKMLREEVGPLDQVCAKTTRGIVNRLCCGNDVQKICAHAVECFDSVSSYSYPNDPIGITKPTTCKIKFEELSPTSVTVVLQYEDQLLNGELGCKLWHRRCDTTEYPEKPSFFMFKPEKRFKIGDLEPLTAYFCKASLISSRGILGIWEAKWVTLAKEESVVNVIGQNQNHSRAESTNSSDIKLASKDNAPKLLQPLDSDSIAKKSKSSHPPNLTVSPVTPCKSDRATKAPSSGCCAKRSEESDYEYSVRVVKWLEDEGHVDGDFRVKFLTWFSLKATKQERRVVSVFVDTFVSDPPSLAGQLTHTFSDKICCDRKPASQHGFCKVCGVKFEHVLSFLIQK